jgi:hypothetical protein
MVDEEEGWGGGCGNQAGNIQSRRDCRKIVVGSRSPQPTVLLEEKKEEEKKKIIIIIIVMNKHMNMNMDFAAYKHLAFVSDTAIHIRFLYRKKQIIVNYVGV